MKPAPASLEVPRESFPRTTCLVLLAFFAVIAIQSFFPLLRVGLITNDDLKLGNAALDRGLHGVAELLWGFTRRDGRLDITQLLSWYLPFAVRGFGYFKAVSLLAIVLDLLLFALLARSVFRSDRAFFLALLLCLIGLQNSWENSPLTAFPGLFTFSFAYLLASLLAFQWYLARGGRRGIISAVLFLLAICSYELYVIYAPLFLVLALRAGRARRQALRATAPHGVAIALYLIAYYVSHDVAYGKYPGVTIAAGLTAQRVAHAVWQFSVSSLPTYFFFHPKYEFLVGAFRKLVGLPGLLAALDAGALIKAAIVAGAYAFLTRRPQAPSPRLGRRGLALLTALAGLYFFAPSVLPALTERGQQEIREQLGIPASYFSFFAWVWLMLALLLHLVGSARRVLRPLVLAVGGIALVFASLVVDYTNGAVAEQQARGRDRFLMMDAFLATPDFEAIQEGAVIYAPSLFRSNGTINFVGAAIDPKPSSDPKYENFWTFYVRRRSGKAVFVTDRLERIPESQFQFSYLRLVEVPYQRAGYFVYASARRAEDSFDTLVSELVMIYDQSPWTSRLVGGTLHLPAGEHASVQLSGGGPSMETGAAFALDVGTHYRSFGTLERSALVTKEKVVDVDSVYLAGSLPLEPKVTETSGWLLDGWIGEEARALLRPLQPSRLVVDAYAPDTIFKKAGIEALTVTLELDHAVVAERRVTAGSFGSAGATFRLEANVDPPGPAELTIHCAPSHVPLAFGISPDDRHLCVVINKVSLRKREPGQ